MPKYLGETLVSIAAVVLAIEYSVSIVWRVAKETLSSSPTSVLQFPSNELKTVEIIYVVFILLLRSIGQSLGIWPCQNITEESKGSSKLRISGPKLSVTTPFNVSKKDVVAFHKAIGNNDIDMTSSDSLIMLFLSASSEPAQLLLLAKRQCPIKPIGAVNVRNRFELLQPEACRKLCSGVYKKAVATASLEQKVRPRKRGLEFDLVVEVFADKENEKDVKAGALFRQVFTVLQFEKHSYAVDASGSDESSGKQASSTLLESPLSLSAREPSTWAAICKDYNPIHISSMVAKLLGMPGKIAHGNHVAAKAMAIVNSAALEVPEEERASTAWMEVNFKRPVKVPDVLQIEVTPPGKASKDSVFRFRVLRGDKSHIEGSIGH